MNRKTSLIALTGVTLLFVLSLLLPPGRTPALSLESIFDFNREELSEDELEDKLREVIKELQQIVINLQIQLVEQKINELLPDVTGTLSHGSRGEAVRKLQAFLNTDPDTRLALRGAGSPGNETRYYGNRTRDAVRRFQEKYGFSIITGTWSARTNERAEDVLAERFGGDSNLVAVSGGERGNGGGGYTTPASSGGGDEDSSSDDDDDNSGGGGGGGYSTPYSTPYTTPVSTRFPMGVTVMATSTVNVHGNAAGTLIGTHAEGDMGTVRGGPEYVDGKHWWEINYDNLPDGWSTEDNLTDYPTPPPYSTPYATPSDPEPPYPTPYPTPADPTSSVRTVDEPYIASPANPSEEGTLVVKYWNFTRSGQEMNDTEEMKYRPRQFNAGVDLNETITTFDVSAIVNDVGKYAGWDYLMNHKYLDDGRGLLNNNHYGTLIELRRSARVAILPYQLAGDMSWLAEEGFTPGGTVTVDGQAVTVYEKSLPAGEHTLGYDHVAHYDILLAEADSTPSSAPSVPSGLTAPAVNETCPDWVHESWATEGPDGEIYLTWHPQMDPVYWCYFRHEHGSDPATFADGTIYPVFNYHDDKGGRTEKHIGFKVFTWEAVGEDGHTYSYMHTSHAVTSSVMRACIRFHATLFYVYDETTDELVARLLFKGDYGMARVFDFDNRLGGGVRRQYIIRPDSCPENAELTFAETNGRRNMNVEVGTYESWAFDHSETVFPITGALIAVYDNPGVSCSKDGIVFNYEAKPGDWGMVPCNQGYDNGPDHDGTFRWFNTQAGETVGFGFNTNEAEHTGHFCTDYKGQNVLDCSDPLAVEQYIQPGHNAVFKQSGKWFVEDPWSDLYLNSILELGEDVLPRINRNLEGAVQAPN